MMNPKEVRTRARERVLGEIFCCVLETYRTDDPSPEKNMILRGRARIEKAFEEYDNTIATHERSIEERLSNLEKVLQGERAI